LTPISPRSSPSSPPSINQINSTFQEQIPTDNQPILERLASENMLGDHHVRWTQSQKIMTTNLPKSQNSLRETCPGSPNLMTLLFSIATPIERRPVGYSEPTIKTYSKPNSLSKLLQTPLLASPQLNENESSKETRSTSTRSLCCYTMLSLMKREWVAWRTQKLSLEFLKARKGLSLHPSGHQLGGEHPKLSDSPSHTERKNSLSMGTTSNWNSQLNLPPHTINSFSMTLHPRMMLQEDNTHSSQTITSLPDSTLPSSSQMVSKLIQNN
jgi:hypothetical protein